MVKKIEVSGYDAFKKKVEEILKDNKGIELNILFTGQKDSKGKSWCPDCVRAEPHIMKAVEDYSKENSIFLEVQVGDRTYWKDLRNPFRVDRDTHLQGIPTLIRWKSAVRLDGDFCAKESILHMFFTEEEDEDDAVPPKIQKGKSNEAPPKIKSSETQMTKQRSKESRKDKN